MSGMSIPVAMADLGATLERFDAAFLMTTDPSATPARVKVVSARPVLEDGLLVLRAPGRGSLTNAAVNEAVTLLWPPLRPDDFSLIVDGTAQVSGESLRVRPTGAVLHRPVVADPGA